MTQSRTSILSPDNVDNLVEQRLAALSRKSKAELRSLPKLDREIVKIDGKDAQLFTFHEVSSTGRERVIVQAIRPRWGGITARVAARGFEITEGEARMLTTEELYDFT